MMKLRTLSLVNVDAVTGGLNDASDAVLILMKFRGESTVFFPSAVKFTRLLLGEESPAAGVFEDSRSCRCSLAGRLRHISSDGSRVAPAIGRLNEQSGGTEGSREVVEDNVLAESSSIAVGFGMRSRKLVLVWKEGKDGAGGKEAGESHTILSDGSLGPPETGETLGSESSILT
jgi:hypothetical protein